MISQTLMASLETCYDGCYDILGPFLLFILALNTFVSNIWATVRLITPKPYRGIAIGIVNSIQNIGYFLSSMSIGFLLDTSQTKNQGFIYVNTLMAILNGMGFTILCVWNICDPKKLNAVKHKGDKFVNASQ